MQITHEEAQHMIQYNADKSLPGDKEKALSEHLRECSVCRTYADQLNEMENTLIRVMRKQWHHHPAPLSIDALLDKKLEKTKVLY